MLISQTTQCDSGGRHGGRPVSLAELRDQLSKPSMMTDGHRQRLLELVQKLERVQGLGGEYSRVTCSPFVDAAATAAAGIG